MKTILFNTWLLQVGASTALIPTVLTGAILGIGILGLVAGYLFYVQYNRNCLLQQQNAEMIEEVKALERKNETLVHQNSVVAANIEASYQLRKIELPNSSQMSAQFKNHFVLFCPKGAGSSSGDFYWLGNWGNYTFLAVVGCTGHRMPITVLSMITQQVFDKTIMVSQLKDPGTILANCHRELKQALWGRSGCHNGGIEVVLVQLERCQGNPIKVKYAGARRPLFYTNACGTSPIKELRGGDSPVGGAKQGSSGWSTQEITLMPGNMLYLTTSGYANQNDANGSKLGNSRLRELLSQAAPYPPATQKKILKQALDRHLHHSHQQGDVLVVGVKL